MQMCKYKPHPFCQYPCHPMCSLHANEVDILTGNLPDVSKWQQSFYRSIQECCRLPISQQTMGTIFFKMANEVDL